MTRRCYIRFYLVSIMAFMISLPIWAIAGEVGNFTQVAQRVDQQQKQGGPVTPTGLPGTEFVAISGTNFSVVYSINGRICLKSNPKQPGKYTARYVAPGAPLEKGEVCLDQGTMSVILANQPPTSPLPATAAVLAAAGQLVTTGLNQAPGACILGTLPGVDLLAVTNDLMSQGANLDTVKDSLSLVCYVLPETYTYNTPGPPVLPLPAGLLPTSPGGGTGPNSGTASPSS
jgi:hypothetical protein